MMIAVAIQPTGEPNHDSHRNGEQSGHSKKNSPVNAVHGLSLPRISLTTTSRLCEERFDHQRGDTSQQKS
ncbi:hypothetical protein, partial [Klebsiella pneumoniae]|uniref:hypothetical protein n=1 Tax=Klebsiella pneumoniae TaxID=573 RepID=UPI00385187D1